jgi:hypothetical protein
MNYGKAEADLERKWPHKYNMSGHVAWAGRVYARGPGLTVNQGPRDIFYGTWGAAFFQKAHPIMPSLLSLLPSMPDWYMGMSVLAVLSLVGLFWRPLLFAAPVLGIAIAITLSMAVGRIARQLAPKRIMPAGSPDVPAGGIKAAVLTALLHVMQPIARLWGRTCGGLTPWRSCDVRRLGDHANHRVARWRLAVFPRPRTLAFWSEQWQPHIHRLSILKDALRDGGVAVRCGGACDRWDLEVRGGTVATARIWTAVEEHGSGRQLTIVRICPRWHLLPALLTLVLAVGAGIAWHDSKGTAVVFAFAALLLVQRCWRDASLAIGAVLASLNTCAALGTSIPSGKRLSQKQPVEPQGSSRTEAVAKSAAGTIESENWDDVCGTDLPPLSAAISPE